MNGVLFRRLKKALIFSLHVQCKGKKNKKKTKSTEAFLGLFPFGHGFSIETACTFILLLGIFSSADHLRHDHSGSVPLTIGLVVFINCAWAGNLTGASMNPARTLGPALMSGSWDHHWVYWVAPTVGGLTGALFYQNILAEKASPAVSVLEICEDKQGKDQTLENGKISNGCFTIEKDSDECPGVTEIESIGHNL